MGYHPSTRPDFWDQRFESGRTPWDFGGIPQALHSYLSSHPHGGHALIPGCGSGYEIEAFAAAGYSVTAIDFSPSAVQKARARLDPALAERVVLGDFFTYDFADSPFDLIYERTFLCALPPDLWRAYADRVATMLKPGGVLAGLHFFGEKGDGPPFGFEPGEDETLFADRFILVNDQPVQDSLPIFSGRERWQERRRKTC